MDYNWQAIKCSLERDYICELRNPKSNEDCEKIYSDSYKSNHMEFFYNEETELCERKITVEYKIVEDMVTHHYADQKCKNVLGDTGENWELARIYDNFEMDLVRQLDDLSINTSIIPEMFLWVNMEGKIEGNEKIWHWMKRDNSGPDPNTKMKRSEIDWKDTNDGIKGNNELCNTIFRGNTKYGDWGCGYDLPVLCERRL